MRAAFAWARSTPVPAKITGVFAFASSSAAAASCASDGCGSEERRALGRMDRRRRRVSSRVEHGTGNLEVNRPRPARPHLAERHADELRNPGPLEHRAIPFHDRLDEIELVLSLECRGRRRIHHARAVLRGDREHGDAFVPRRQQAGHEVRGARTRVAEHHRNLAGRLVEAFGHVHGRSLVPDRHEADAVGIERSQQRIDLRARQPEDELDAFVGEGACKQFATSEFAHGLSPPEYRASLSGAGLGWAHCVPLPPGLLDIF